MMRRSVFTAAVAASLGLAACGGSEVVVQAQLEGEGEAQTIALRDLPIRLLPYDRDAIFDSLRAAYPEPQPEIPAELQQLEAQISQAQSEWQTAEQRWIVVRDSLQRMSSAMQRMNRQSGEYRVMFAEFTQLEGQESGLRRQSEQAFRRFEQLQGQYSAQADEIRVARENWADEAFAPVDSIIRFRMREMRRDEVWDTLGAQGTGRVNVQPGRWWVHARYDLPYQELYWNVPIDVTRGEQVQVMLNRQNAEVRPKL
jgi:hypothetical protein